MRVLQDLDDLTRAAAELGRGAGLGQGSGLGGVLAPTMGALHAGHAALIAAAAGLARRRGDPAGCVVSIFVNPTQFNEAGDYQRYPRPLEADLALCERAGATFVFAPSVEAVYPPGVTIPVPPLPPAAEGPGLEDRHRPGHFAGVAQVVSRLFDLVRPAAAVFGEKDWQQLQVVRGLAAARPQPIDIEPFPTVREPDGLALSSRNVFLSAAERARALALCRALRRAVAERTIADAESAMAAELLAAGVEVEYAVVRDAATLRAISGRLWVPGSSGARALVAARLGSTRLIDNERWGG